MRLNQPSMKNVRNFIGLALWGILVNAEAIAQNFWQQTNGPTAGHVQALTINHANGHIFAGTKGAGVFRSEDNGLTWKAASTDLTDMNVMILAANHKSDVFAVSGAGIFRWDDAGHRWSLKNSGLTNKDVRALLINAHGKIFAGTYGDGVFFSLKDGDTWSNSGLAGKKITCLAFGANENTIYAGIESEGVFLSTDNGATWRPVPKGFTNNIRALVRSANGQIYAGTQGGGIFRLSHNDSSWTPFNANLTHRFIWVLALDAKTRTIFVGTDGGGIFRFTEGDSGWTAANTDIEKYTDIRTFAVKDSGKVFVGTRSGGIFHSTNNGASWKPANTGLIISYIWAMQFDADGDLFAGTDYGGVFHSIDQGNTWKDSNDGLPKLSQVRSLAASAGYIFAGLYEKGVYRFTKSGGKWELANNGLASKADVRALIIKSKQNSKHDIFAAIVGDGVFRSDDHGANWSAVNGLPEKNITMLAVNKTNGYFFAGAKGKGIYRSEDGQSWALSNTGLEEDFQIFALAINDSGHVFAGTKNGVYRSRNNGNSWAKASNGLTLPYVYSLAINASGHIFAGTSKGGVFRSINNGGNWTNISTGSNLDILSLVFHNTTHHIFAGSGGSGIFKSARTTVDPTPPTLTSIQAASATAGEAIPISATVTEDKSLVQGVTLHYKRGGGKKFNTQKITPSGNQINASIPDSVVAEKGVEFYLKAINDVGISDSTSIYSIQVNLPNGIQRPESQPAGSNRNAYRLIAIPLELDNTNRDNFIHANPDLGTDDKKIWRMYDFNGTTQPGKFVEDPNLLISPGTGYLLIVNKPNVKLKTGSGKTVKTAEPFQRHLLKGWNVIGNPFNYDIPVDSVIVTNGSKEIWTLANGKWLRNTTGLKTWEGYAVWASEACALRIKPGKAGLSAGTDAFDIANSDGANWLIQITAKLNDTEDVFNFVGQNENAVNQYDRMDLHKAPALGGDIRLEIYHPDWNEQGQETFTTDIRQANASGQSYDFDVFTSADGVGILSFAGLDKLPNDYAVYLFDKAENLAFNLRNTPEHHFAPASSGKKSFRLIVGTSEFVTQNSDGIQQVPAEYQLAQNYPNPFNPTTTIRYGLPQNARVTLKVFDRVGQEVATLVNEARQATGYHVAIWDGRNQAGERVASGLFFYQLQAGDRAMTKKMILVK